MMTPTEILNAAAERIEREGWIQGYYVPMEQPRAVTKESEIGPSDMTGAIHLVASGGVCGAPHENDDAAAEAKAALRAVLGVERLTDWNDAADRTESEVTTALRMAAAEARDRRFPFTRLFR